MHNWFCNVIIWSSTRTNHEKYIFNVKNINAISKRTIITFHAKIYFHAKSYFNENHCECVIYFHESFFYYLHNSPKINKNKIQDLKAWIFFSAFCIFILLGLLLSIIKTKVFLSRHIFTSLYVIFRLPILIHFIFIFIFKS
jgi:hypothetical protein